MTGSTPFKVVVDLNSLLECTEKELEVLLVVETTVHNRPLSYVEDDVQMPILTTNSLLFGRQTKFQKNTAELNISTFDNVQNLRRMYICYLVQIAEWIPSTR
jgi:hypothetical protein